MDNDTLCPRLLFGDPSLGTIENRVILEATILFIKNSGLFDWYCNIKPQIQPAAVPYFYFPMFVFVLFFVYLVLFHIVEVDDWDIPCTAIFFSRFTATS